jgi:ketosteroid isomerase-like protein
VGDREELVQGVAAALTRAGDTRIEFNDIQVTLGPDSQSAAAKLTARGTQRGAPDLYLQEFNLTLTKKDRNWRIATITPIEVFK